jgi:hypothetical protein
MRIAEPDLDGLLGRFADAITLIRVSHRSLDAREVAFEEEFVLRRGLVALDTVYNELDLAIVTIHTRIPRTNGIQRRPFPTRRGYPVG